MSPHTEEVELPEDVPPWRKATLTIQASVPFRVGAMLLAGAFEIEEVKIGTETISAFAYPWPLALADEEIRIRVSNSSNVSRRCWVKLEGETPLKEKETTMATQSEDPNGSGAAMTERELYERVVALRKETDALIDGALAMPTTIELCVFTGKLGAVLDVLMSLEGAGVPICDPDEEPHHLGVVERKRT